MRGTVAGIVVLLLAVAIATEWFGHPTALSDGGVTFLRTSGLVYVELARAGGGPLLALLDTGANASAVDPRLSRGWRSLGTTEVVGTTGSVPAELVEVPPLRLGDAPISGLRATSRDLSGLLRPAGRRVDMILGSDAFAGRALTIDFRRSRLQLGASGGRAPAGAVEMTLDNGIPAIRATLDGLPVRLRLDTGASLFDAPEIYVNVPGAVWDTLRVRRPSLAPFTHFTGTDADGRSVELPVVRLGNATIGPMIAHSVRIVVQPRAGYFASPAALGFVCNNYLAKLGRVTLDFGAGRLFATR